MLIILVLYFTLVCQLLDECRGAVQHFLQRAHTALKSFGGGVNPLKTKVNFDTSVEIEGRKVALGVVPSSQQLQWCGLAIDMVTLEVSDACLYTRNIHMHS